MRRFRRWLIVFVVLALLGGAGVAFYFKFVDTRYSVAEFYADTAIIPGDKTGKSHLTHV